MEVNLKLQISSLKKLIEDRISTLEIGEKPNNLYDPIRYILKLGGKRLRPLLALLSYSMFNKNPKLFVDPAIGVEVFHNFTLIHDDIMDKAPLRRGKPTVHKKWREETAILSGDVMLVQSYQLMMTSVTNQLNILDAFNQCALSVCEGQQMDIDFEETNKVSIEEYLEMIRLKTAVLLGFSMELGALGANAKTHDIQLAKSFGEHLGIAFQLKDDILDVFGESEKVGKQTGGDIISNKKTYLWIKSFSLSNPDQQAELVNWMNKSTFDPTEKVTAVKEIFNLVNVLDHANEEMEKHFAKASEALELIDVQTNLKKPLQSFYKSLITREQ